MQINCLKHSKCLFPICKDLHCRVNAGPAVVYKEGVLITFDLYLNFFTETSTRTYMGKPSLLTFFPLVSSSNTVKSKTNFKHTQN
jgi:hypothetical protein